MHVLNGDAGIDDVHVEVGEDIGDRSAAADIDSAQLSCLESDLILIHDMAQLADEFRVRVIAAALAAGTGIFIEDDALA